MEKVKLQVIDDKSPSKLEVKAWTNFVMKHVMSHFRYELLGNHKYKVQEIIARELKQYHSEFDDDFLYFDTEEDKIHFLLTWG